MKLKPSVLNILIAIMTLLIGCWGDPITKQQYQIYFILAPINTEQAKLSKRFLLNAKENNAVNGETQIITPNNSYTVVELCERDTPDFLIPGINLKKGSDPETVTKLAETSVKKIIEGNKKCTASSSALVEVSKNLNQAASGANDKKIIVFLQAPWSKNEVPEDTLKNLTNAINKLAKSNRVEKIILFGVAPNGADRLATAFQALNNKSGVAHGEKELVNHLKEVSQKYFQ